MLRLLLSILLVLAPASAQAQGMSDSALVAYLSTHMPRLMQRLNVPGGVLTVVRGNQIVLDTAFGFADRERQVPVSADTTVFRIASVSKIFTSIAALQLYDDGRLSLDADLRPLVPELALGAAPLTMRQLLTHTAGLDERMIGYLSKDTTAVPDLAATLARTLPARRGNAGVIPGYSNHGYALAALVVERVSGESFRAYVTRRIFEPIDMRSTAFVVPPFPALRSRMATEYRSDGVPRAFSYSPTYPAGNVGTVGSDMGRFLIALLGRDARLLTSAAYARLMGPELTYDAGMPPMGLGFAAERIAPYMMWIKGGASRSHSAVIALFPELDVGIFVAVNRQEPLIWDYLLHGLRDSVFISRPPPTANMSSADGSLSVDGVYRWTRAPRTSIEKVLGLAAQIRVKSRGDSLIITGLELDGRWARRDGRVYQRRDGREVAFRPGPSGQATHAFSIVQGQPVAFERIPFHQTTQFQGIVAIVGAAAAVAAAVIAARRRQPIAPWERTVIVALPAALIALLIATVALARQADAMAYGPTTLLYATAALSTTVAALAALQAVAASRLALREEIGMPGQITYGVGALGSVAMLGILAINNLIGFQF